MEPMLKREPVETRGRIRVLLSELGVILSSPPRDERHASTGVSIDRTARVSGLQAIFIPLLVAPILALVPPTEHVGDVGWAIAAVANLSVVAIGLRLIRMTEVSPLTLAAANSWAAAVLGVMAWLSGGFVSPYTLIFPLLAASITPHTLRMRAVLMGWLFFVSASPLLYQPEIGSREVAYVLMVWSMCAGTLATMMWLSYRVGASEAGLMDAVTSAQTAQEELEVEAERLTEISEARERLVSRVSHELRTPLTSIRGYIEALIDGESGDLGPAQRDYATIALRNTLRLEMLITDLLLLSRVETGHLELNPQGYRLEPSIRALTEELSPLAKGRLIVEVPPETEIEADRIRLEQAITNLMSNAIKYSNDGGPVLVRARDEGQEVVIEVIDKGVGIPSGEIHRLGERFFRASTAGDNPGTGLGIAITRELVELHGGRLDVESEVGAGSIFRVRLPRRQSPD